jgi:hypothetical protein
MFTFMNLGFGAGSFLDGLVYDTTGSYDVSLIINAVLGGAAAVAVLAVTERSAGAEADVHLGEDHPALTPRPAVARGD